MKKILLISIAFILLTSINAYSQFVNGMFMQNGYTLPYKVSFPDNYDSTKQYPLVVFLHGAGERGSDNEKQLVHGKSFLLDNTKSKFPAIVIAPQCPADNYWANVRSNTVGAKRAFTFGVNDEATAPMKTLISLVEDWLSSGKIDKSMVYVGGLSMGGMGTLEIVWRMPGTFAAAFPICGGGDVSKTKKFAKKTAIWLFHGDNDGVVPPVNSSRFYETLKSQGCDVKFSIFAGVGHNSWDNAFKEEALFPWLFSHKKAL